jgi:hypothetical protein
MMPPYQPKRILMLVVLGIELFYFGLGAVLRFGPANEWQCRWAGREGWVVDVGETELELSQYRETLETQTTGCVQLRVVGSASDQSRVTRPYGRVETGRLLQVTAE